MAIFWTSNEKDPPRNRPWPPVSFADEVGAWIDERAVERTASAIRMLANRIGDVVPGSGRRQLPGRALASMIRHRRVS